MDGHARGLRAGRGEKAGTRWGGRLRDCEARALWVERLGLWCALADSLAAAQAALATVTPEELDRHSGRQGELCRQLGGLGARLPDGAREGINAGLAEDLQRAVRRVAELNRFYGAMLRRRRRTGDIFCRLLASSGTTYPAPTGLAAGPGRDRGEGMKEQVRSKK